jgi:hypothetical protein
LARAQYDWIESRLLRTDHLYWCDYSAGPPSNPEHALGPIGQDRPRSIHVGGSVTYLGGNMGMGACQADLYDLTGEEKYRAAALRTADAIHEHLCDAAGVFINDRDAYTNGFFVGSWSRSLAGLAPSHPALQDLRRTAEAVARSRTSAAYHPAYGNGGAGYYPADWNGHAVWETKGSMANMMHVSATSVAFLTAAASLEQTQP